MRAHPVDSMFLVEPGGQVSLGAPYGRVAVAGKTPEQAEAAVQEHLCKIIPHALAEVSPFGHATRWRPAEPRTPYRIAPGDRLAISVSGTLAGAPIDNEFVVGADGEIFLGLAYGTVAINGLTLEGAERAIGAKLEEVLGRPEVSVTLSGWETDRYLPAR